MNRVMAVKQIKFSDLNPSIVDGIRKGKDAYENVIHGSVDYITVDIDCDSLPDPIWERGRDLPVDILPLFNHIPPKQTPCLYYFEILEGDHQKLLDTYRRYREKPEPWRAVATLKKRPPVESTTLYVGKVKTDVGGRFVVHLGYYHVPRTAGLQLVCWSKNLGIKLRLHVFAFPVAMQTYISSLELGFARSLRPMIGKH